MGCCGSKSKAAADVPVAGDVYRPPATSVSLFDISAVEEPWLIASKNKDEEEETDEDDDDDDDDDEDEDEKAGGNGNNNNNNNNNNTVVPLPLLEKLEGYELAPASWSEVSKALEDMKPALQQQDANAKPSPPPPPPPPKKKKKKTTKQKKKKQKKQKQQQQEEKPAAAHQQTQENSKPPPPELAGRRVVKDNPFLMRDRENNASTPPKWRRRDPFEGCPERRPPGASGGGVVLYTTTLRGVRRTFEDCERARELVDACAEAAGIGAVDERDVSLHADYLRELRELLAAEEGAPPPPPPRLFVMGRYVGGAEDCVRLSESGKLREMMRWAKARGEACAAKDGRGCMGCGGARFVPCWECGGSCKVVALAGDQVVQRCAKCNENGLMMCPICH